MSSDGSYVEGAVALLLLVSLQFVAATVSARLPWGRTVLTARPTLLVDRGRMLGTAMAKQRIDDAEIRQALRASGFGSLAAVGAVVLETDGSFSVVSAEKIGDGSALTDLDGFEMPSGG